MKTRSLHPWNLTVKEAMRLQTRLARKIVSSGGAGRIRTVAGADVSAETGSRDGFACVVVMSFPDLEILETVSARVELRFPYVPGLLAFREAPVLLQAISKLRIEPDLFLIDGQGIAHPRGFGIASHIGLLLNRPTIGCAKSRLCGTFMEPGARKGSSSALRDEKGRTIGRVLRTRDSTRPIFVSIGHRIGLASAAAVALSCCGGYRIPEPTRQADLLVGKLRRAAR